MELPATPLLSELSMQACHHCDAQSARCADGQPVQGSHLGPGTGGSHGRRPPATTPRAPPQRSAPRRASACSPPAGGSPWQARALSAPAHSHVPALLCRCPADSSHDMVKHPVMDCANTCCNISLHISHSCQYRSFCIAAVQRCATSSRPNLGNAMHTERPCGQVCRALHLNDLVGVHHRRVAVQ